MIEVDRKAYRTVWNEPRVEVQDFESCRRVPAHLTSRAVLALAPTTRPTRWQIIARRTL